MIDRRYQDLRRGLHVFPKRFRDRLRAKAKVTAFALLYGNQPIGQGYFANNTIVSSKGFP